MKQRGSVRIAAIFSGVISLLGWWINLPAFTADPFQDWAVFHAAARAYLRFDSWGAIFRNWSLPDHPWLYPPSFLLLLLPFGGVSFGVGCAAFLMLTLVALLAIVWKLAPSHRGLHLAALLLSPAAMVNFYLGQNAFLSGALLFAGAMSVKRRPLLAGVCFGLLLYKPQLALMVPVALIAARSWRALGSAAVTALCLILASTLVFGAESWQDWIAMTSGTSALATEVMTGRMHGGSVFTCAILLGASPLIANLLQAAAIALAAGCVYASWRSPMAEAPRLAVLFAATVLAAPHVTGYDAILLAFAGSLLFVHGLEQGFGPGEGSVALLTWASPIISPPMYHPVGRLTPLLIILFIAMAMARGFRAPSIAPSALPALVTPDPA